MKSILKAGAVFVLAVTALAGCGSRTVVKERVIERDSPVVVEEHHHHDGRY